MNPCFAKYGIETKFAEKSISSSLGASSLSFPKISIPGGMPDKVKSIMERFEEVSNDRMRLQLREEDGPRQSSSVQQRRPPSSSHVDERSIFGRELEKEEITKILSPSNGPDFMVLPIVGMGGLGKTTLAQLVYNDLSFYGLFEKRAWVSVSDDFDLVRLTRAIIESITKTDCVVSELSTLQDILKDKIKDRTLLIVLDDVWNDKKNLWEGFRVAFNGAKTIRILVTTRITLSASIMLTTSAFHLQGLSEEKCWLLFSHYAFNDDEESERMNLLKIGRAIVKKCKGSPLAVKALGGILRYEMDEEKWNEVLASDIWQIDENNEVMPALQLSYKKLPVCLRPCFLYLSLFPKNTPFEKEKIVQLWMTQGYINGNTRTKKTLEEIGSEYFDELQGRSLIIESWNCKYFLHDLIHDLAKSISEGTNLPDIGNNQQWKIPYKGCHMYLFKLVELAPCNNRAVRTLIMYPYGLPSYIPNCFFSHNPLLRALELTCYNLPSTIGNLKHLRYLSVSFYGKKKLPESLCLLFNLQSLSLDYPYMSELPKNISHLVNLRLLRLKSGEIEQLPESVCRLHDLHTITMRDCPKFNKLPRTIGQLANLHVLILNGDRTIEMPYGIGKLTNLKTLSGHFTVMGDAITGGLGELQDMNRLCGSLWISGLKKIADVEFSRKVNLQSKPNLNKLILNNDSEDFLFHSQGENLLHITVILSHTTKDENNEKIEDRVLESFKPHGNLKKLFMCNFEGKVFPSWLFDSSVLPKLTDLQLYLKTKFACLPPSLGKFPHLINLSIWADAYVGQRSSSFFSEFLSESYSWKKLTKTTISSPNFASLEELELKNILNWEEWQVHDGDIPSLKNLMIDNCPKLRNLPVIPVQIGELRINNCGCEEIKFSSKCKLGTISISGCPNLLTFSATLEELVVLKISDCGFREINLSSLFSIKEILISNCRELVTVHYRNGGLPVLKYISLISCPKLLVFSQIPEELQELSLSGCSKFATLEELTALEISDCDYREIKLSSLFKNKEISISNSRELVTVHDGNGDLPALREISLKGCPKIMAFSQIPEELQQLSLFGSPKLLTFSATFEELVVLEISDCGFQEINLSSLFNIKEISISNCRELVTVLYRNWDFPNTNSKKKKKKLLFTK